ncbi:hypothetical protein Tco_0875344 [Tanacetum coccineum]|uniref:Uncharacterized protein n=1 Tax=Tanacetum coccineum TaxID=301880 RepID=A0ABQ5BSP6_9ASTR
MLVDDLARAVAILVYPIDLSSKYLNLDYDWIRGIVRTRNRGKVISPIPLTSSFTCFLFEVGLPLLTMRIGASSGMIFDCANIDTIRLRWGSKSSWGECSTAKSRITCDNTNGNTTLRIVYHDLILGGKALVERENVGFNLTKSDLCPSFVKDLTAKGVGLCVADSHTSKHREDGFTPLETIQRLLGISRSKSHSSSKGRPSSHRGGFMIHVVEENGRIHKDIELKRRSKFKLKASRHLSTVLAITQSYVLGFS